jgi:hypothetical protein
MYMMSGGFIVYGTTEFSSADVAFSYGKDMQDNPRTPCGTKDYAMVHKVGGPFIRRPNGKAALYKEILSVVPMPVGGDA